MFDYLVQCVLQNGFSSLQKQTFIFIHFHSSVEHKREKKSEEQFLSIQWKQMASKTELD